MAEKKKEYSFRIKSKIVFILCVFTFLFGIVKGQESASKLKEQRFTKLLFSSFGIIINNFNPLSSYDKDQVAERFGDTSEITPEWNNKNVLILKAKKDTINMEETVDNYFRDNLIKILNRNKSDIFKVSFSYNYRVFEPYDYKNGRTFDEWDKNKITLYGATKYEQIKDSVNCYYRVPQYKYNYYENQLKKEMNLRDTLVTVVGEYAEEATLIYKSKPCVYKTDNICIRIERYVGTKLKETKYIIIYYDYYG